MLLGAQIVIARHAMMHFAEDTYVGFYVEHSADGNGSSGNHNKKPQSDKLCQICLFSKSFSHVLLNDPALVPKDLFKFTFVFPPAQEVLVQAIASAYQPRAPPAFLI